MLSPGGVFGVQTKDRVTGKKRMVICLATKNHWRDPSQIEWIVAGVNNLNKYLEKLKITSVAVPLLGAGLGHLDKKEVEEVICKKFSNSHIDVRIYCESPRTK
jgi:O-acetyl-ADP-ribose deacetylase (regulator of RNase III)